MFVVTGDSWACGSWGRDAPNSSIKLMNRGLSEVMCIPEVNILALNLGMRYHGNFQTVNYLTQWVEQNPKLPVKYILFFVSDHAHDMEPDGGYHNSIARYYHALGKQLGNIAQYYPVQLIGGSGDVPETLSHTIPTVCPSFTNFLLEDNAHIDSPVLSVYGDSSKHLIEAWKQQSSESEINDLYYNIDRGKRRQQEWSNDQKYFFPDKEHPNLSAHAKLFWYIKTQLKFLG